MIELAEASHQGSLLEIFGAGTAAVIASVASISHLGHEITAAPDSGDSLGQRLMVNRRVTQVTTRRDQPYCAQGMYTPAHVPTLYHHVHTKPTSW